MINNTLNTGGGTILNNSGVLAGSGTVGGSVENTTGTVAPGNSPGILTIGGNYTQGSAATLAIEIAGTGHDQLTVDGSAGATLDGPLDITTVGTYSPGVGAVPGQIGDTFKILTANSVNGTFSTTNGNHAGSGKFYLTTYNSTDVTLGAFQALAGDADGDKDVDVTDFNTLANNFDPSGASPPHDWTTANFDLDNDVDVTDFNALANNFVPGGYGGGTSQVPGPAALILLVLGLGGIAAVARGRLVQ